MAQACKGKKAHTLKPVLKPITASRPQGLTLPSERICESFFFLKTYSTGSNLHSNQCTSPEPLEGSTVSALSVFGGPGGLSSSMSEMGLIFRLQPR